MNRDQVVNLLDVDLFVAALAAGTFSCEADIDMNGTVDLLDVQPFIELLGP